MTASEKNVIDEMRRVSEEQPEIRNPDKPFLRDWAYGNAGLEDERITLEQVEEVLSRKKSA